MAGAQVADPHLKFGQLPFLVDRSQLQPGRCLQTLHGHGVLFHQPVGQFLVAGLFRGGGTQIGKQVIGAVEVVPVFLARGMRVLVGRAFERFNVDHVAVLAEDRLLRVRTVLPLDIG
jgi:hypothetical protein